MCSEASRDKIHVLFTKKFIRHLRLVINVSYYNAQCVTYCVGIIFNPNVSNISVFSRTRSLVLDQINLTFIRKWITIKKNSSCCLLSIKRQV